MYSRILIWGVLLVISHALFAQIEWQKDRKPFPVEADQEQYPLYYLYRGIHYDFKYDDEGTYVCDITYHEIVRTTNEEALSAENKSYISTGNVIEILDSKARTISRSGEVVALDQDEVKEVEDEENESGYRIFAVEGAEVGGEIEYRYVKRVYGNTFLTENLQFSAPVGRYDFLLTCPENLEFDFFTANDSTQVTQIDTVDTYNQYAGTFENIPEFVREGFSGFDADKKRIDIKLAYNSANGNKRRLNTFADAGKTVYTGAVALSKEEEKALQGYIKQLDPKKGSKVGRLKVMEHEAKQQLIQDDNATSDLVALVENGIGNNRSFLKLFVGILEFLELEYEIVVTIKRTEKKFEASFDSWRYLDEYLIYLPAEDTYFSPAVVYYRYGIAPSWLTATKGLYIKPTRIQDFIYPVTRIAEIPAAPYQHNMSNLYMDVDFNDDFTANQVQVDIEYIGEEAEIYKAALQRINEQQKEEMLKQIVQFYSLDSEVSEAKVKQGATTVEGWKDPVVIAASFETEDYLQLAGNNLLLQVGKMIGPQSELYQDDERRGQVENSYNRGYRREINISLPKGYEVQNLDDILIKENVYDQEELIFTFDASYEVAGNQLKIVIDEYYNRIYYPKEQFEAFRKVINAAADWNKVVLVMKKV